SDQHRRGDHDEQAETPQEGRSAEIAPAPQEHHRHRQCETATNHAELDADLQIAVVRMTDGQHLAELARYLSRDRSIPKSDRGAETCAEYRMQQHGGAIAAPNLDAIGRVHPGK